MRRFFELLPLLVFLFQLGTNCAVAVTGVDACVRPDGVGENSAASSREEEEIIVESEDGSIWGMVISMPESSDDEYFEASAGYSRPAGR